MKQLLFLSLCLSAPLVLAQEAVNPEGASEISYYKTSCSTTVDGAQYKATAMGQSPKESKETSSIGKQLAAQRAAETLCTKKLAEISRHNQIYPSFFDNSPCKTMDLNACKIEDPSIPKKVIELAGEPSNCKFIKPDMLEATTFEGKQIVSADVECVFGKKKFISTESFRILPIIAKTRVSCSVKELDCKTIQNCSDALPCYKGTDTNMILLGLNTSKNPGSEFHFGTTPPASQNSDGRK